ncbi:MAG: DNA polymerase III, subunit gamma and tau [Candidatus Vogelbacteria bacterium RIFOXYD1_FULL_46_19]|uniref:DNA polymerase III subunit gamma/tau n=1 Tax=Candidatus Vogelbacteria bacterium RIFOXYD1_FULL_46_19 TaxID=1802439 RepID=A0A1G2QFI9_9BACT|nr:MAG: DNA polymerase III, subunit gamma and tau [Candidatus Vogelbacteria bacterium RIFOXYD1_FULL_46_19]
MSHDVLYRKYRPQKFSEVSGQESIISILAGEIKSGNFAHAYLFSGSRGTGKTSVARILAKELGCSSKDLYEIDAASNTGVDDVRVLREGVRSLPFESPLKVYLIDEVHMLSKAAFNALLKTLEEPPAHVVFILATTELHKVPDTVISRCELYAFKRPTIETLTETVTKIVKKEGTKIDQEAAALVAFLGDGSFRDTLGVLQKVLAAGGEPVITLELVEAVTGATSLSLVQEFIKDLLAADADQALKILAQLVEANLDLKTFNKRVLAELRSAMLVKYAPGLGPDIKAAAGADRFGFYETIAAHREAGKLSAILKELLEAHDLIGSTYLAALPLELAVINITEKLKTNFK